MTPASLRCCAVIPVFDNAATVVAVARAAAEHVDVVIVVDDGSRDRTNVAASVAAVLGTPHGARIVLITFGVNRGKGAALLAGLRRAHELGFTHAVTLDADGQHRASDIPALVADAAAHPQAIVVGARRTDDDRVPDAARVGRRVSNFWTLRCTGFDLSDTTCGLRVYPVREVLDLPIRTRRYDYEGEVLVRGAWAGLGLRSVPVDVWYPDDRSVRVSHYRPWADSVRITVMYVRLGLGRLLPRGGHGRAIDGIRPPTVRIRDTLRHMRELTKSGTRNNELALALGIGVFLGATPLWGLHSAMTLYVATRWRLNLVAAFLASNVSFPLFAPVLVFAEVKFGHLLRTGAWLDLQREEITIAGVWSHAADYLVGGFAFAALLGIAVGLATLGAGVLLSRRGARPAAEAAGAKAGTA
jgi:glycosyltransferase involved in cell wall biosynthesis